MGCGGSRADAIEPRYYESWTRETESTWLTNTDSESPQEPGGAEPGSREPGAGRAVGELTAVVGKFWGWLNACHHGNTAPLGSDHSCNRLLLHPPGILEDGKSTQTGGTATPATTGILGAEKRAISGPQCVNAAGTGPPRQSSFRAAEGKRDTQKTSAKEVTISVSKTIRPSDRRITKNCVN
ncbi:hypothetical protein ASZ78_011738 [Callipepla squamata]|uniref:BAALC protein n=1 Tax=Callipepla squamata TaxID=9009 RepID=A0A226MRA1_CALSU|nr:hypothetical protein ASZ78_011738 [Callipepla squamata]